jgi:8-oxo-dGTP pyrophosphatase MutT (NUDIX family)
VVYAEAARSVQSVAMSALRNSRVLGLTIVQSEAGEDRPAEFLRLSQLRNLRECEQVAAVCYRVRRGAVEFLLVRTRGSERWTFPKGSAEPGLTHAQAAALEAFEEAGVHGRIEQASFARYGRRVGRSASAKATREKVLTVNAHLCEVLRLGPPQESKRNRTWFPVAEARRRLREGRRRSEGVALVRVVDKAVARLQKQRGESGKCEGGVQYEQKDRSGWDALPKDALRKVQFDFAETYARTEEASAMPQIRQTGRMQRIPAPMVHSPEFLRGEVLQFETAREKRVKALRAGTNFRG